jgi:cellulose synthase/poly-beta-1,6-N-acetylglucosamine synthase-like glycosyltransferase
MYMSATETSGSAVLTAMGNGHEPIRETVLQSVKPFVSVIVPVYNCESSLARCIESLLQQDYPKERCEIIFVDNDSTDRSAEIIKKYPVIYAEERQVHTSYGARNTGAKMAKGEILAFCDADQYAAPQWLSALLQRSADPEVGAFAGEVLPAPGGQKMIERYMAARESCHLEDWKNNRAGPTLGTGNAAFRTDLFRQIGGFDQSMASGADLVMGWTISNDLRKQIAYEKDAVMYHQPRTTEAELLRRQVRLAYGRQIVEAQMQNRIERLRMVIRCMKIIATGSVAFALRNVLRGNDWRFRAYSARMNALLAISYIRGMAIYLRHGADYTGIR